MRTKNEKPHCGVGECYKLLLMCRSILSRHRVIASFGLIQNTCARKLIRRFTALRSDIPLLPKIWSAEEMPSPRGFGS